MEKQCVVCHLRPSMFRCIQCHKPVCDECAFKTENGVFCGRNCATAYRDFRRAQAADARKAPGGLLKKLALLILLAAAAAVAAYVMGWLPGLAGTQ